jgi:hypothetical protein
MAVTFAQLSALAIPQLKGCAPQIITQNLQTAALDFLQRSEVWRHVQTQSVVADQTDYTLSLPSGATHSLIKRLKGVWYGDESANQKAGQLVSNSDYSYEPATTLAFYYAYTAALTNGLTTECVIVPDLAYTSEIPDRVMDDWAVRAILPLAIAEIKEASDQPYSDTDGAKKYREKYTRSLTAAIRQNIIKRKSGNLRVVPPAVGGRRINNDSFYSYY